MASADRSGFRFLRAAQSDEDWPWFQEHYEKAPRELLHFLEQEGRSIGGQAVADVGCGDGIIDLGLVQAGRPASLVGFDLEPTDVARLTAEARRAGVIEGALPPELSFRTSTVSELPAPDDSYDTVVSWSTFEHVRDPVTVLREIRRILKPDGIFFLQIWPLYFSMHGSHLWPWYPEGYAQLSHPQDEIERTVAAAEGGRTADVDYILRESRDLNRVTIDELQYAILAAGMFVAKFELLTGSTHVSQALSRHPLTDLGISGITLIAVPAP